MGQSEEKLLGRRRWMVEHQLRRRGITDERVLAAFEAVERERFVPADRQASAYEDAPLPIGHGQTISQPYIVALMLQELRTRPDHRVLDIGAGSGYQTVLLARLVEHVFAIERIAELTDRLAPLLDETGARNVSLRTGDGSLGWAEAAPFDGIICGAAAPNLPESWADQLVDGGRIVLPVGGEHAQELLVAEKHGGKLHRRHVCGVRFVRLIGEQGWPET